MSNVDTLLDDTLVDELRKNLFIVALLEKCPKLGISHMIMIVMIGIDMAKSNPLRCGHLPHGDRLRRRRLNIWCFGLLGSSLPLLGVGGSRRRRCTVFSLSIFLRMAVKHVLTPQNNSRCLLDPSFGFPFIHLG